MSEAGSEPGAPPGEHAARDEAALDALVRAVLARATVEAPASDFADRVMRARASGPGPAALPAPPRRRRLWMGVAGGAAAAALLAVLVLRRGPEPAGWHHVAVARESVDLDGRGVAVLEPGSELRRRGDKGGPRFEQLAGSVFYRIDRGRFGLATAGGEVLVLGTCFRVEVPAMKLQRRSAVGFALGAGLSAAIVVTVYEGRVRLANGSGEVELGPGQRGRLAAGEPPRVLEGDEGKPAPDRSSALVPAAPGLTIPSFAPAADRAAADELQALRARVAEQDKELQQLRHPERKPKGQEEKYTDVGPEELRARAARCEIRYDIPDVMDPGPQTLDEKDARRLGLSDTEREAFDETLREVHLHVYEQLRRLYTEMSGDGKTAERLSPSALVNELFSKAPRGDGDQARARLAKERAGLLPAPPDLAATPIAERTLRLMFNLGDDFERRLGGRVGADRAHALRARNDGWGGSRTSSSGCGGVK